MLARSMYVAEYAGEFAGLNAYKMDDGRQIAEHMSSIYRSFKEYCIKT